MSKPVAGLLIVTGTVGLLYTLAAIVVFTLVATSRSENTPLDYATAERRAAAEYRAARAQCQSMLVDKERAICIADAHAAEKESRTAALYGDRGSAVSSSLAKAEVH
jgi:hypothetical protein